MFGRRKRASIVAFPISEATKHIVVRLRIGGMRRWSARLWLSMRLFRFAGWICPLQFSMSLDG